METIFGEIYALRYFPISIKVHTLIAVSFCNGIGLGSFAPSDRDYISSQGVFTDHYETMVFGRSSKKYSASLKDKGGGGNECFT